ncbi:hypothetical protein GCK72_007312 [Caenorhabditis remanei]|uniref:SET domain-containing protein n=1 Tax=Caenorhabditis remanei TaxID=31234 RepID=A0A6A5HLU6_CAERE|nr:hypothetical protein GCK72_007312 [Caenorhabditis remanei]KAF1767353.1 hypothetical protein GCK72_007312 [Caenorhabditis remanei]
MNSKNVSNKREFEKMTSGTRNTRSHNEHRSNDEAGPSQGLRQVPQSRVLLPLQQNSQNAPKRTKIEKKQNDQEPTTSNALILPVNLDDSTDPPKTVVESVFDDGSDDTIDDVVETDEQIATRLNQTLIAIVITNNRNIANQRNPRVKVITEFKSFIPHGCIEANRAQRAGSWRRDERLYLPGIPAKKFCVEDVTIHGDSENYWQIQTLFMDKKCNVKVYFVGWSCLAMESQKRLKLRSSAPAMIQNVEIRNKFLESLKRMVDSDEMKYCVDREKNLNEVIESNPDHIFWAYQDLSFFHSKVHLNNRMGTIFYMCMRKEMVTPPVYAYSTVNVVHSDAYLLCEKSPMIRRLLSTRMTYADPNNLGACETPGTCRCNYRFNELFKSHMHEDILIIPKNRQYDKHGLLDLEGHNNYDERVVMECSDACGCSWRCPRRQLQRGQQLSLVVYYLDEIRGFGMKAAEPIKKGQFISEYVGEMRVLKEGEKRNTSYDAGFALLNRNLVITSENIGNVSRFFSHACTPNAAFMEVYSRRYETDPLIPRIGVFALQDIEVGEDVTVSYWSKDAMPEKSKLQCK